MPRDKRKSRELQKKWTRSRNAEGQFGRTLRALARHVDHLCKQMYDPNDPTGSGRKLRVLLDRYADVLGPWAHASATRMVMDVSRRDGRLWKQQSQEIGRGVVEELSKTPLGDLLRKRIDDVSGLITSLPREAAKRVQGLTLRAMETGARASEISRAIMQTGLVTKSRADLIARTEVARTSSELVRVRAEYVGSEGYIWTTVGDLDVRKSHRKLSGKFIRWDSPPEAEANGLHYHAGAGPNCRCFPIPVIPDEESLVA